MVIGSTFLSGDLEYVPRLNLLWWPPRIMPTIDKETRHLARERVVNVGIRELRDGLSRHLASVRDGQEITVTDHGKPVAKLVPINQESPLERLIAEGLVTPPTRPGGGGLPEPIDAGPSVRLSELVIEMRR